MKRHLVAVFAGLLAAPLAALTPPLLPPIDGGPDFQVNVTTQGSQETPDVARDAAGDFAVAWADRPAWSSETRLMVRLYESSGAPKTGEILVWPANQYFEPRPRIAMTPQGAFVVVWASQAGIGMRRFDRFGQPDGAAFVIDPTGSLDKWAPDVAMDAAGNVAVVWTQNGSSKIFLQRLDAEDRPLEAPRQVDQASTGARVYPRVALNAAGGILVSWDDYRGEKPDVYARRFDGPAGSWAPEVRVHADSAGTQKESAPLLHPEGDGLVLYHDQDEDKIFAQRLDAAGALLDGAIEIGDSFVGQPDVAAALNGKMLAVWSGDGFDGPGVYGHLLERNGKPVSHPFLISTPSSVYDWYPAVAGGSQQGFAVAWNNGDFITFPITPPPPRDGRDGSLSGVFARAFVGRCLAGSDVLCLRGGRFEVRVTWRNPVTGGIGAGRALPLTNDTGALWFLGTENLELMIKVLDGSAVNGHFWVYYGALSDLEYTLTVTDTQTGRTKTYSNPRGRLASRADVGAFPAQTAPPPASGADFKAAPALPSLKAGSCQPSPEALCLNDNRFRVTVEFADPRLSPAVEHQAQAIPLTRDTGTFYFFQPENLELMIKILDGRPHNGRFWIYYGALSDVAYRITVEDTETGQLKTYDNLPGSLISRADVEAF